MSLAYAGHKLIGKKTPEDHPGLVPHLFRLFPNSIYQSILSTQFKSKKYPSFTFVVVVVVVEQSTCRLNNRCHPDMIRDFVEHGTHDAEEYPFSEELQVVQL